MNLVKYSIHLAIVQPYTIFTEYKLIISSFTQCREKMPPKKLMELIFVSEFTTVIQHIEGE